MAKCKALTGSAVKGLTLHKSPGSAVRHAGNVYITSQNGHYKNCCFVIVCVRWQTVIKLFWATRPFRNNIMIRQICRQNPEIKTMLRSHSNQNYASWHSVEPPSRMNTRWAHVAVLTASTCTTATNWMSYGHNRMTSDHRQKRGRMLFSEWSQP